ncbi:MAG: hypothetical protein ONB30_09825 [candidate division KSB1 bacterium]|nr:hypothetical protein [candidate division KSB1 bacterium]MDZ7294497.1 hypothetical protein [candidate division KSB1 bacterium]MDZ7338826.1 hypothetical protein [candidate division KSB1 bacterium]MDZ7384889.1 hypothetical protein [candidate division KSB1 bacterium]MDZ7391440.1 hypothetical protein [candidate division KSB1 bacterium]
MATELEIQEENRRLRWVRMIVDLTAAVLQQEPMSLAEALALARAAKQSVLRLFPDKEATYDLIYKPRFERLIKERMEQN